MKPYSKYKDSGIEWLGEIPSGWSLTRLKYLFSLESGRDPKSIQTDEGKFPIYGTGGEVGRGTDFLFDRPSLLLGRKGTIDKPFVVNEPFWVSDVVYFTIQKTQMTPDYLWLLSSLIPFGFYRYGSTMPSMSKVDYENMYFPEPPIQEQQQIGEYLDKKTSTIEKLIAKKERQIELLKEKRSALISHAVTKGLNPKVKMQPSGIEWLGEIPEHWAIKELKFVARLASGDSITSEDIHEFGDYPVFGGNGLRGYTSVFNNEGEFPLIGRQGALCGCINYSYGRFWASEHAVVLTPLKKNVGRWLGELLRSMNLNQYSQSAAQPGLVVDRIAALHVPEPPQPEQQAIAYFLSKETSRIDELIVKIEKSIEKLQEYRTALISAAVTGKIDVR